MNDTHLHQTTDLIRRDFDLEPMAEPLTEEQLFELLAEHIEWLIEHRLEWLLSLMYRLDIAEEKVRAALSPLAPEPPHRGLARLVLERQKQRVFTKQHYRPEELDDEEWRW